MTGLIAIAQAGSQQTAVMRENQQPDEADDSSESVWYTSGRRREHGWAAEVGAMPGAAMVLQGLRQF